MAYIGIKLTFEWVELAFAPLESTWEALLLVIFQVEIESFYWVVMSPDSFQLIFLHISLK